MTMEVTQFIRVTRHLREATGYLELGMAQHAVDHLKGVGDMGPLEPAAEMLRGEAYFLLHRYKDAALSLESAARKFAAPQNRSAWFALSQCYRKAGDVDRAIQTLGRARGARPPKRGRRPPRV
jgi:tetratricopeptide (TPR) repeat protein